MRLKHRLITLLLALIFATAGAGMALAQEGGSPQPPDGGGPPPGGDPGSTVPEPSGALLFGAGVVLTGVVLRRRAQRQASANQAD